MNTHQIGQFLQSLRRDRGLTQEQLGERLGVTGKTVSRWETGAYLPPVEMLLALSELYQVSMNELVLGERIAPEALPAKAEEAVTEALRLSPFLLKERQTYWERKWNREHRGLAALCLLAGAGLLTAAILLRSPLLAASLTPLSCLMLAHWRNRRAAYVEHHLYDEGA